MGTKIDLYTCVECCNVVHVSKSIPDNLLCTICSGKDTVTRFDAYFQGWSVSRVYEPPIMIQQVNTGTSR